MSEIDKPIHEVYFFWMDRTMKAWKKASNQLFRDLGINITSDQWIILKRLSEEKGLSQRELAQSISKDPASVTRILDLLEKEKLIERVKADRRSFTISLTTDGEALIKRVLPEAIKYREKGTEGVSNEEMEIFRRVLDKIQDNFSS
ncbi:MarR family winged helix-turn-helix transcriptional regulator [Ekhidna sp. To15]|uniref:MarR family winged helix-turn-helix transcriptional regulator n=1 Tax=Ekhidna sp. To15 TaxID=3395267 RepID=UPI003F5238CF